MSCENRADRLVRPPGWCVPGGGPRNSRCAAARREYGPGVTRIELPPRSRERKRQAMDAFWEDLGQGGEDAPVWGGEE